MERRPQRDSPVDKHMLSLPCPAGCRRGCCKHRDQGREGTSKPQFVFQQPMARRPQIFSHLSGNLQLLRKTQAKANLAALLPECSERTLTPPLSSPRTTLTTTKCCGPGHTAVETPRREPLPAPVCPLPLVTGEVGNEKLGWEKENRGPDSSQSCSQIS